MPKLYQTDFATGRAHPRESGVAGTVVTSRTTFTFPAAASAGDMVELLVLPPRHMLVGLRYVKTGTVTEGKIGLMAGEVGDTTLANRAIATNLITSGRENDAALAVTATDAARAIGVEITSADAGASVTVFLLYAQG